MTNNMPSFNWNDFQNTPEPHPNQNKPLYRFGIIIGHIIATLGLIALTAIILILTLALLKWGLTYLLGA